MELETAIEKAREMKHKYFNSSFGFGSHRETAIELLKKTILLLEEFHINYFIISGTLLGYIRHDDFIPWDDDIDLIVDSSIFNKLQNIMEKYSYELNFIKRGDYIVKTCFKNKDIRVECEWDDYVIDKNEKYHWPFVDLFIYRNKDENTINFFEKDWSIDIFFPIKNVKFVGLDVNIPNDPHSFLLKNYGNDYMKTIHSGSFNHKNETHNVIIAKMTLFAYNNV